MNTTSFKPLSILLLAIVLLVTKASADETLVAVAPKFKTTAKEIGTAFEAQTGRLAKVHYSLDADLGTDFLRDCLMVSYEEMRELASSNNQPNLNSDFLASFRISCGFADLREQAAVSVTYKMEDGESTTLGRNNA